MQLLLPLSVYLRPEQQHWKIIGYPLWIQEGTGESANIIIPGLGLHTVASRCLVGKVWWVTAEIWQPSMHRVGGFWTSTDFWVWKRKSLSTQKFPPVYTWNLISQRAQGNSDAIVMLHHFKDRRPLKSLNKTHHFDQFDVYSSVSPWCWANVSIWPWLSLCPSPGNR